MFLNLTWVLLKQSASSNISFRLSTWNPSSSNSRSACKTHSSSCTTAPPVTVRAQIEQYDICQTTKFQRLHTCFLGQTTRIDYWEYCPMSGYVLNQRCRPLTGSVYDFTYISARIHDSNEIPTAKPMIPWSGNTYRLLGMLPYVWVSRKLKMAAINRKFPIHFRLMAAIFDFQQAQT